MAIVYRCTQKSLDRDVALKVMMPEMGADKSMCERFLKEGKIIAKLEHPNIVTIYDIGRHEDNYYMSMEICTKPCFTRKRFSPIRGPTSATVPSATSSKSCSGQALPSSR